MSNEEQSRLMTEVLNLRRNQIHHCADCAKLKTEYTGTFNVCPYLGSVNIKKDGCTRWIKRGN